MTQFIMPSAANAEGVRIEGYETVQITVNAESPVPRPIVNVALYLEDALVDEDSVAPFSFDQTSISSLSSLSAKTYARKARAIDDKVIVGVANLRVSAKSQSGGSSLSGAGSISMLTIVIMSLLLFCRRATALRAFSLK
ncbi:hypothetical protein [Echinimonas agarilytica]|nr:hypothetical protein [Echinimonas agarilytica]